MPEGLPIKLMVVGVVGLLWEKVNQDTVEVGVTGMIAEGALVTVTGCCTGPPPRLAFRNTTLGVAVIVFCARRATAVLKSIDVRVSVRNKRVKGFNFKILQQRLRVSYAFPATLPGHALCHSRCRGSV